MMDARQFSADGASSPSIRVISSASIQGIAKYILNGDAKNIVVMAGAGISTSAGIPDFRSPETGLYANLQRLHLPYAEAVFDISYFRQNPEPFYVLAKEIYPGKFYPTISHSFAALLQEKGLLATLFSQNVDTLERRAGVPAHKLVEAHGSFATQHCIDCKEPYPDELMMRAVEAGHVPHCLVTSCNGLVKPDIVFFGEALPPDFLQRLPQVQFADLVIVMGTSLSVLPFAALPSLAHKNVPRLLLNLEQVGDLGQRLNDVVALGSCDDGVRKLADALGWREELETLWARVNGAPDKPSSSSAEAHGKTLSTDEALLAEIQNVTHAVEKTLKISNDHIHDNKQHEVSLSAKSSGPPPTENVSPGLSVKEAFAGFFDKEVELDPTMPQNRPNSL